MYRECLLGMCKLVQSGQSRSLCRAQVVAACDGGNRFNTGGAPELRVRVGAQRSQKSGRLRSSSRVVLRVPFSQLPAADMTAKKSGHASCSWLQHQVACAASNQTLDQVLYSLLTPPFKTFA